MWSLYQQSKEWGMLPSSIIGVDPDCSYLCWCFDEAVLFFGRWVEGKLNQKHTKGPAKGRAIHSLSQILDPNFKNQKQSKSVLGLMAMAGNFAGPAHL